MPGDRLSGTCKCCVMYIEQQAVTSSWKDKEELKMLITNWELPTWQIAVCDSNSLGEKIRDGVTRCVKATCAQRPYKPCPASYGLTLPIPPRQFQGK